MNNYAIYLSQIETIFNSWKRYLLLSETTKNLRYRCAPSSETIGGLGYMCDRVGSYCIRPSIIPNENGQSFGDSLFIHSSLAGCLWGVCNTPLHGYAYLIDRWQGRFYVGAYCIRPSIILNKNGQSFGDLWSIRSSIAGWLQGVCNTPLPGYTHWIDGWYRCFCVGAYCIRPSINHAEAVESFGDSSSIHSSLAGWLWGVCNTPLHGYTYLIDVWLGCFQVGVYLRDERCRNPLLSETIRD